MYIDITGHSASAINFSCNIPIYDDENNIIEPIKYYIGSWKNGEEGLRIFKYENGVIVDAPLYAATPDYNSKDNQVATVGYVKEQTESSFPSAIILKGGSASSW